VLFSLIVVEVVASVPITTSAYRLFLRGPTERIGFRYRRQEGLYIGAVLRVAGRVLLWGLLWLVMASILAWSYSLALGQRNPLNLPPWQFAPIVVFVEFGGLLIVAWSASRYSLVPAAASVGHKITMARSVRWLRGQVWRLLGATFVVAIPILLIETPTTFLFETSMISFDGQSFNISYPGIGLSIAHGIIVGAGWIAGILLQCAVIGVLCQTLSLDLSQATSELHRT